MIIALGGLSGATSFYIYISFSPFKNFLTFPSSRYSRAHSARGNIPFIFKYLPLVSKGGWLPPFHSPSSATYEIIHYFTNTFYFYFEVSLIIYNNFTKIFYFSFL